MPSGRNQGQGLGTEMKIRGLSAAFAINLSIFKNKFNNGWSKYMHFDLNCGSGYNEQSQCIGSPIAFLSAVKSADVHRYRSWFVDNKQEMINRLSLWSAINDQRITLINMNNKEFVRKIPECIVQNKERPQYAVGSVLSDPNGSEVPIDELAWLSRECPRLDIILHWNSTTFKRCIGAFGDERPSLEDALSKIEKKHWLIRKPVDKWQWTLLVGRNFKTGAHKNLGFYELDSKEGQDIFQRCNLTASEYREATSQQMEMFL